MKTVGSHPVIARSASDVAISGRGRCDRDVFGLPTRRLLRSARNDAEDVHFLGSIKARSTKRGRGVEVRGRGGVEETTGARRMTGQGPFAEVEGRNASEPPAGGGGWAFWIWDLVLGISCLDLVLGISHVWGWGSGPGVVLQPHSLLPHQPYQVLVQLRAVPGVRIRHLHVHEAVPRGH